MRYALANAVATIKTVTSRLSSVSLSSSFSPCVYFSPRRTLRYSYFAYHYLSSCNNLDSVIGCHAELAAVGAELDEGKGLYQGF